MNCSPCRSREIHCYFSSTDLCTSLAIYVRLLTPRSYQITSGVDSTCVLTKKALLSNVVFRDCGMVFVMVGSNYLPSFMFKQH